MPGTTANDKIKLTKGLRLSRIVHGHWRLKEWNLPGKELLTLVEQAIDLGVTSFDHADNYGNYECEQMFGEAVAVKKGLRKKMQLVTKMWYQIKNRQESAAENKILRL